MRPLVLFALLLTATAIPLRAADTSQGRIVYSRKDGDRFLLHVMNADGTGDKEIPGQTHGAQLYPTWSPDGKRIGCMGQVQPQDDAWHLLLVNADGSGVQEVNTPNKINWPPAFSPDGKLLAFSSADQVVPVVHVSEPTGANFHALAMPGIMTISPFWKRDGSRIGYTILAPDLSKSQIVMVKPDGGDPDTLVQGDLYLRAGPDGFSPDGKRLAYLAIDFTRSTAQLRVLEMDNRAENTLGDEMPFERTQGYAAFPVAAWSPDGKWLVVSSKTEKGWGLFRVSPDGKERTRLTPEDADCRGASWIGV